MHNAAVTNAKRAAIEAAAERLELTFPPALVDVLEQREDDDLDPWTFLGPAEWKRLRTVLDDVAGETWTGVAAVVIGSDLTGNLVCVAQEGKAIGFGVYLLDQESLGLELIAPDIESWLQTLGDEGDLGGDLDADDDLPPIPASLIGALLGTALDDAPPPEPEASPQLRKGVEAILAALVKAEVAELEDDRRDMLIAELCAVVGEARSPKDFVKRFVRTIVDSDNVEEVYGTDDQIGTVVKSAMEV